MTFTAETVVAECLDEASSMPTVKYNFLPINEIANKAPDNLLGNYLTYIANADGSWSP